MHRVVVRSVSPSLVFGRRIRFIGHFPVVIGFSLPIRGRQIGEPYDGQAFPLGQPVPLRQPRRYHRAVRLCLLFAFLPLMALSILFFHVTFYVRHIQKLMMDEYGLQEVNLPLPGPPPAFLVFHKRY